RSNLILTEIKEHAIIYLVLRESGEQLKSLKI
ncbi:unnamed protein product, partial [marine sediment metagenome]